MGTVAKVVIGIVVGFFVLGGIIVIGALSCTMCGAAALSQGMAESERVEQAQLAEDQKQEERIPWLAQVQQTCQRYKAQPNDIQKSAVFQENQAFVRGKQLVSVRGVLESASTGHGGGGLFLRTKVGRAVFGEAMIRESDPIYAQAANLSEGQCVVFSGGVGDTSMVGGLFEPMEQARICQMEYDFEFVSISACPAQ
jgi:hypothetical protein